MNDDTSSIHSFSFTTKPKTHTKEENVSNGKKVGNLFILINSKQSLKLNWSKEFDSHWNKKNHEDEQKIEKEFLHLIRGLVRGACQV